MLWTVGDKRKPHFKAILKNTFLLIKLHVFILKYLSVKLSELN